MKWLAIAAVCIGCKGGKPAPKRDDAAPSPIDAAALDAAPLDAAPLDGGTLSLVIASDGVGPITSKATDEDAFKKLLPGFTIKSSHRQAEDIKFDEIVASKDGRPILRAVIEDENLFKVTVKDPMFATAAGITVGMTAADLARKMADLKCRYEKYDPEADAERVERSLRCDAESLPHILFELDHQGFKGPVGAVAGKSIAARKIVEIVWLAPED